MVATSDEIAPAVKASGRGRGSSSRGPFRIHAVARLTGVPEPTLRAWERRYGVPVPERTPSGYRLYHPGDVAQIRTMRRLCDEGIAAAEAARTVLNVPVRRADPALSEAADPYAAAVDAMLAAVDRFDDVALNVQIRRAMFLGSSATLVDRVLTPTLVRIGQLWRDGKISVAQEHLASQRLRTMMNDLVRLSAPEDADVRTIVACFADEEHEIGALAVAMRLAMWGTRPVFLGARTPPTAISDAVARSSPRLVALSVTMVPSRARARELVDGYASACGNVPFVVGGGAAEKIGDLVRKAGGIVAQTDLASARPLVRRLLDVSLRDTASGRVKRRAGR